MCSQGAVHHDSTNLRGKVTIVDASGRVAVELAKDVVPVDVPLDPALAIANRFQELAK